MYIHIINFNMFCLQSFHFRMFSSKSPSLGMFWDALQTIPVDVGIRIDWNHMEPPSRAHFACLSYV